VNVGNDPVGAQEMVSKSGQRGVPVIVLDEHVVVGFDQARLEQLLATAHRHVPLGASVADAGRYSPGAVGAYVGQIHPGSAAERAGLRVGDVIVEIGGHQVRSAAEMEQLMAGLESGARLTLKWRRGDVGMQGEAGL
jgi:S1-C subfamily serine protease